MLLNKKWIPTPLGTDQIRSVRPPTPQLTSPLRRFWAIIALVVSVIFSLSAAAIWPPLRKSRYSNTANARRLRDFLEAMGGSWIKLGHLLAMHAHVLGDAYCDELSQLRDIAEPMPIDLVQKMLESQLGSSMRELFTEFDDIALASTSTGQYHLARLRVEEARVTVKVRRPGAEKTFRGDLGYMRFIVWCFTTFKVLPHVGWKGMLWEIEKAFTETIDYRAEAEAAIQMRKNLRRHRIYAPRVFIDYAREGVMIREFVPGVSMAEYIMVANTDPDRLDRWRKENGIDPKRVGMKLFMSHNRQVFEDNLFHCEAAPHNILLLRESRVALLNFDAVGTFDTALLEKYRMLYAELASGDYHKLCDIYMLLGPPLPTKDLFEVRHAVVQSFRAFEVVAPVDNLPYAQRSLTSAMRDLATIFATHRVPASWEFMRLNRSDLALDLSLQYLVPGIDFLKSVRRYLRKSQERTVRRALSPQGVRDAKRAVGATMRAAKLLSENLNYEGEWMRQRRLDFQAGLSKGAKVGRLVSAWVLRMVVVSGVFLSLAYLREHHMLWLDAAQGTFVAYVIDLLSAYRAEISLLIIGGLLNLTYYLVKFGRRLSEPEVRPEPPR